MAKHVLRTEAEMVSALRDHVSLLCEYHEKAFIGGEKRYYGEIAAKLRLLLWDRGRNEPLLLKLIKLKNFNFDLEFDEPGGMKRYSLEQYVNKPCWYMRTPSGPVDLTPMDLITSWAQQAGAAHEDWTHSQSLAIARSCGIYVGGKQLDVVTLESVSDATLTVASRFLEEMQAADSGRT